MNGRKAINGSIIGGNTRTSLAQILLGFLGVSAAIFLFPRIFRFFSRHLVTDFLTEIVGVVAAGLLTERVADKVAHMD